MIMRKIKSHDPFFKNPPENPMWTLHEDSGHYSAEGDGAFWWFIPETDEYGRYENDAMIEDQLAKWMIKGGSFNCEVMAPDGKAYKIEFYQTSLQYSSAQHDEHFYDCFTISDLESLQEMATCKRPDINPGHLMWTKSNLWTPEFPLKLALRLFSRRITGEAAPTDEALLEVAKAEIKEKMRKWQERSDEADRTYRERQETEQRIKDLVDILIAYFAKNFDETKAVDYNESSRGMPELNFSVKHEESECQFKFNTCKITYSHDYKFEENVQSYGMALIKGKYLHGQFFKGMGENGKFMDCSIVCMTNEEAIAILALGAEYVNGLSNI